MFTWPLEGIGVRIAPILMRYRLACIVLLIAVCVCGMMMSELVLNYVQRSFVHNYDIWFYFDRIVPFRPEIPIVRLFAAATGILLSRALFASKWWPSALAALACVLISPKYSPGVLFCVFICWWAFRIYSQRETAPTASHWAFWAAVVLGTGLRVDAWMQTAYAQLGNDVGPMVRLARESSWFYDSGFREPLWVNISKLSMFLFGTDGNWAICFPYLLLSIVWMPAVYTIGGNIFDRRLSLAAVWLIACNRSLVYYVTRGMRVELYGLLLFIVIGFVCSRTKLDGKRTLFLALALVGICLTRLTGLTLSVYFAAVLVITRRIHWTRAVLLCIVAAGAITPYMVYCKQKYGHTDYMLRLNSTWVRNLEFAGQPGFPTKEEVAENACVGEQVNFREYLFRYHTVGQIIQLYAVGFMKGVFGEHAAYVHYAPGGVWWMLCFTVGCFA
ncbi:MAG: glycosyltransferase family 39 protein, partial [bacterium]